MPHKKNHLSAMLMLNLACLFWAVNMVLGKMLSEYVGPWFIISSRTLIGSLLFIIILARAGKLKGILELPNKGLILGMSLTGVIGFQALLYYGLHWTTPINASVIGASAPFASLLLAAFFLNEKLTKYKIISIIISFVGVLFVLSKGQIEVIYYLKFNFGDVLIFLAVLLWAIFAIFGEIVMQKTSALQVTAATIFLSAFLTLPMAFWEASTQTRPEINTFVIVSMIVLGIGPTVISFLSWNKGVHLIGSAHAALYLNTIPVYTILISFIFLNGQIMYYQTLGMFLIITGSLLMYFYQIKK